MRKKKFFLFGILILIILSIFFVNLQSIKQINFIKSLLPSNLKFFVKEEICKYRYYVPEHLNERIFPQTQFLKLNYKETKIKGLKSKKRNSKEIIKYGQKVIPFYIETFGDKNILIAINGNTVFYNTLSFIENDGTMLNQNYQYGFAK